MLVSLPLYRHSLDSEDKPTLILNPIICRAFIRETHYGAFWDVSFLLITSPFALRSCHSSRLVRILVCALPPVHCKYGARWHSLHQSPTGCSYRYDLLFRCEFLFTFFFIKLPVTWFFDWFFLFFRITKPLECMWFLTWLFGSPTACRIAIVSSPFPSWLSRRWALASSWWFCCCGSTPTDSSMGLSNLGPCTRGFTCVGWRRRCSLPTTASEPCPHSSSTI